MHPSRFALLRGKAPRPRAQHDKLRAERCPEREDGREEDYCSPFGVAWCLLLVLPGEQCLGDLRAQLSTIQHLTSPDAWLPSRAYVCGPGPPREKRPRSSLPVTRPAVLFGSLARKRRLTAKRGNGTAISFRAASKLTTSTQSTPRPAQSPRRSGPHGHGLKARSVFCNTSAALLVCLQHNVAPDQAISLHLLNIHPLQP